MSDTATRHRELKASPETSLAQLIQRDLAPRVTAIDLEGEYPEAFLRRLGALGGFAGVISPAFGGSGKGLVETISTMAQVGESCLSTAFTVWCQTACARYIQLSDNAAVQAEFLPRLANGQQLGGTGLSNTLKSNCEIERFLLTATRVDGGYEINGTLPWVSNLGDDHIFVTGCPVDGEKGLIFFVVQCNQAGFKLVNGAQFTALEGTRTLVRIPTNLDSDSEPNWTRIPEQAGQSERSDAGFSGFTLLMSWGSSFCRAA